MKRYMIGVLLGALLFCSTAATASAAQGFYLGGDLLYNSISGDFDGFNGPEADPGAGLGLIIGYGFTPAFALQIDWNKTVHDSQVVTGSPTIDGGYGAFIIGFKYNFRTDQPAQPYIHAGLGVFTFAMEDDPVLGDVDLTGTGFDLGIGVDYYVNSNFSIGAGLTRRIVEYDEIEIGGTTFDLSPEVDGDTTTIDFSFVYHFGAGWTGGGSEF